MNERFEIEPSLAERWTFVPESNTYRFELRQGVRFHDGAELTADDVKYTFDLIIEACPDNYQALGLDSVHVRDRYLVEMTPTKTNHRLVEQLILAVAGLSFLGLGAQPPTPEWGTMINEGTNLLFTSPHVMLFPGAAVAITVVGFNLVGEALYEAVGVDAVRTPWL